MLPAMDRRRPTFPADAPSPPGLYDGAEEAEEDLWFLPAPDDGERDLFLPPAAPPSLVDAGEWRAAEAALAADLAALAWDHGRLAERLSMMGEGARMRLAQAEALSLGWWSGDRIAADRLALWQSYRLAATGDDVEALSRLAWVARRLAAPPARDGGIALHLGDEAGRFGPLPGESDRALSVLDGLDPATKGAAAFQLWQGLDERPGHLRGLEAAVLAARIGAGRSGAGGTGFLPQSLAGFGGLIATGGAGRRLAAWIAGAHQAVLSAMMTLERLRQWQLRAAEATGDLSGRTPGRLIACLARHPMVAAPQAEAETGASRAAIQRNLDTLVARDLIREVTGQGRFRVWTARL